MEQPFPEVDGRTGASSLSIQVIVAELQRLVLATDGRLCYPWQSGAFGGSATMARMDEKPKRRWFRFGLRTLFVVFTLISLWLGYNFNWIRQRRDAMKQPDVSRLRESSRTTPRKAPWPLWLLGEEGAQDCFVVPKDKVKHFRRLFPETFVFALTPEERANP